MYLDGQRRDRYTGCGVNSGVSYLVLAHPYGNPGQCSCGRIESQAWNFRSQRVREVATVTGSLGQSKRLNILIQHVGGVIFSRHYIRKARDWYRGRCRSRCTGRAGGGSICWGWRRCGRTGRSGSISRCWRWRGSRCNCLSWRNCRSGCGCRCGR